MIRNEQIINNTAPPEVVSVQTADDPFSAPGLDRRFSFYRAVNERIREVNAAFGAFADNFEVFCECGARNCLERVEVPAKVYEDVLSGPRSLVKAGHESAGHGVVVAESGSYVVIEADASIRREASFVRTVGSERIGLSPPPHTTLKGRNHDGNSGSN